MPQSFAEILAYAVPLILAITFHEAAHGFAASYFGDDTARRAKRVSLNPLRHIDPVGTVILPWMLWMTNAPFLFGYAKPVPVNFFALRPYRAGMFFVAFAGPLTNLILALISALLLHMEAFVSPEAAPHLFQGLILSIRFNCVLVALNLLPILPLDGGRMLAALLPDGWRMRHAKTERLGLPILLLLLAAPLVVEVDIFSLLIGKPAFFLMEHILALTGNGSLA